MSNPRPLKSQIMRNKQKQTLRLVAALFILFGTTYAQAKSQLTMYYPIPMKAHISESIVKQFDALVEEFMQQNPDIQVTAHFAGDFVETREAVLTALKNNSPIHLSILPPNDLFNFLELGVLVAYDDLIESSQGTTWLHSFYPALMENTTSNGKTWGVPFYCATPIMIYNKEAFRAAGLDPESPPQNWQQLAEVAKTLTNPEQSQWGLMIGSNVQASWILGALAMQNDHVLMSGEGNKTFLAHPPAIEALTYWRDLKYRYQVMPSQQINWHDLNESFYQQKAAIIWQSTSQLNTIREHATFDYGVAMLPAGKRRGTPTGGANFYIFNHTSKEQQADALKFIQFMTQPEQSAKWSVATGYLGTSPESYETQELSEYVEKYPQSAIARDQLEFSTPTLTTYQSGKIINIINTAVKSALRDEQTPSDALRRAQDQAEHILKPYQ